MMGLAVACSSGALTYARGALLSVVKRPLAPSFLKTAKSWSGCDGEHIGGRVGHTQPIVANGRGQMLHCFAAIVFMRLIGKLLQRHSPAHRPDPSPPRLRIGKQERIGTDGRRPWYSRSFTGSAVGVWPYR